MGINVSVQEIRNAIATSLSLQVLAAAKEYGAIAAALWVSGTAAAGFLRSWRRTDINKKPVILATEG